MAEEIDDNGFYREDFSAESDWEVFNVQLCDLFQKWELADSDWGGELDLAQCQWQRQEEQLEVMGKQITVEYYKAQGPDKETPAFDEAGAPPFYKDLLSVANAKTSSLNEGIQDAHYLARIFGLRRFVVLHPKMHKNHYFTKASKFNFFLSSLGVVAAEMASAVPLFVQIHEPKLNFFLGVGMSPSARTNFHSVAMTNAPQEYCYLSGLVKMFKEKIPRSCDRSVMVSARNTYSAGCIKLRVPMYVPFGMTPSEDENRSDIVCSYFTGLPHGYFSSSNMDMFAEFQWPELSDNVFIDSPLQTQFVPSKAPGVSIYQKVHATSYLSECLKDYFSLKTAANLLEAYVGKNFFGPAAAGGEGNPLENLTHSQLHKLTAHGQGKTHADAAAATSAQKKPLGPIRDFEMQPMLAYLFPDIYTETGFLPYEPLDKDKIDLHRIKSAAPDSLVHRLSCLLATCHGHFGGKSGMAQLYATFIQELRSLWDRCIPIPGVAPGNPDSRTCLLHQKLQLLNVCIAQRKQRERGSLQQDQVIDPEIRAALQEDSDDDEEDVFYDVNEAEDQMLQQNESPNKSSIMAEGRLRRLDNLCLLESNEPLYIPVTQEVVMKTEDQLQDEADNVLRMGADSEYITDLMRLSMIADAEAFKAANPNAKFEDFIRWFSPNDCKEYMDEEKGLQRELSIRMQGPTNTWRQVWDQAKPVPVTRQKPLFDDTLEAYKVLSYLESCSLGEIFALTVVPLMHTAILKLMNMFSNSQVLELFNTETNEILADISRFSRDIELIHIPSEDEAAAPSSASPTKSFKKYTLVLPDPQNILKKFEHLGRQFYQYLCFKRFWGVQDMDATYVQQIFREMLGNNGSCYIRNSTNEASKKSLFKNDARFALLSKEYLIRVGHDLAPSARSADRPMDTGGGGDQETISSGSSSSPVMPQFLRAFVNETTLRLCGAFTEHTTFLD